jgi:trk system potassium uptake protein TrkH
MQIGVILRILGALLMIFSLTLLPPIAVALIYQDGALEDFTLTFAINLFVGLALYYTHRHKRQEPRLKDGFVIVVLFWTVLGGVATMPFLLADSLQMTLSNAVFEAFSGLTTTGATVITQLEGLPHAILFYRQQLQWMGGMGIIVLAVAILPMLGVGGMQLYKAETPGPMKDTKLAPRISETAKTLWYIYAGLTLACALAYWLAGMNAFDAIGHSFSTVAIGGFSTHDASMGYFDNVWIELIAMVFMVIAGVNFALHFTAWRHLNRHTPWVYFKDPEFRTYLILLGTVLSISTLYLFLHSPEHTNFWHALRHASFQAISISTTTGFSTTDFSAWPNFLPVFLIMTAFIGGCAFSTAGGMKVIRFLMLFKQGLREISRLLHPQAEIPVKIGNKPVSERVLTAVWGFFSLYVATFILLFLAIMMTGIDQVTAFSAVTACLTNLGPGLGEVSANYASLNDAAKWILAFAMLLGRLEIFTLIVLFTRAFWRA